MANLDVDANNLEYQTCVTLEKMLPLTNFFFCGVCTNNLVRNCLETGAPSCTSMSCICTLTDNSASILTAEKGSQALYLRMASQLMNNCTYSWLSYSNSTLSILLDHQIFMVWVFLLGNNYLIFIKSNLVL